jgi:hypothetical protein
MSQNGSTSSTEKGAGFGMGSRVKVVIEGPYGGPGSAIPSSFSSALVVVGGSGITFGTSTTEELIVAAETGSVRTKYVELVWVVQEHCESSIRLFIISLKTDHNMICSRYHASPSGFRDSPRPCG